MPKEKKRKLHIPAPADTLYPDDGKPHHDNPHHAGVHSHQRRAVLDVSEINFPIHFHARPQCTYVKPMKRN